MMPFAWTIAKFLFKVVAPSVPEIVSTVARLKKQPLQEWTEQGTADARLGELEQTVAAQLQLIEQLTNQLQTVQRSLAWALRIAVSGLVLSCIVLGILLLR